MYEGIFRVLVTGTTNKQFTNRIGSIGVAYFTGVTMYFCGISTSYVVSYILNEGILTVNTRNSTYTFEVLSGDTFEDFTLGNTSVEYLEDGIERAENYLAKLHGQ